jgi:hypothetical protein
VRHYPAQIFLSFSKYFTNAASFENLEKFPTINFFLENAATFYILDNKFPFLLYGFRLFFNPFQGQNYLISANIFVDISQQIFSEFVQNAIGVNLCYFSDKVVRYVRGFRIKVCSLSLNWPFFVERVL